MEHESEEIKPDIGLFSRDELLAELQERFPVMIFGGYDVVANGTTICFNGPSSFQMGLIKACQINAENLFHENSVYDEAEED